MAKKPRQKLHEDFESRLPNCRFIKITDDMMNSQAWKKLDPFEITLYLYIKNKYRGKNRYGESTHRNISFTYREGKKLMSKVRFTKSIDKLIETGFVDIVESWRHTRQATIYGLSARWHDYGTEYFKEAKRQKNKGPYKSEK